MKSMQSFSSHLSALLMLVFTFSVWSAQAEIVEPRYVYYHNGPHASLEEAKPSIIFAATNGAGSSEYWTFANMVAEEDAKTMNGIPRTYYLEGFPTEKAIKEYHIEYKMYKFQGSAIGASCPIGFTYGEVSGSGNINGPDFYSACYRPDPCPTCDAREQQGNPVAVSTGTKTETVVDYRGAPGLDFERNYRSDRQGWVNNFTVSGVDVSAAATSEAMRQLFTQFCVSGIDSVLNRPYCFRIVPPGFLGRPGTGVNEFGLQRGNGRMSVFGTANNLNPPADINDRVTKVQDTGGSVTGWAVYNAGNESTEYFDLKGKLTRVVERSGMQKQLTYSDASTPSSIANKPGLLIRITNHFGQQLNFTYDPQGRMQSMIDPAGGSTNYAYDEASSIVVPNAPLSGNLTSVTYPDGKKRVYWYNEQDKTNGVNLPLALTGITDENGVRFATWTYDSLGRALSSEHAGGVEKYTFAGRGANENPEFTNPLGVNTVFAYTPVLNQMKLFYEKRTAGSSVIVKETGYDVRGNISMYPDNKGNRISYTYDTRNLETQRIDAYGSADAQTTTTSWHANYRIPVQINTPLLKTSYTHDTNGNVLTKTEQATSDTNGSLGASAPVVGNARTWTYTYNTIGQVLTVTGPRTDVVDKTTYTYDNLGNLNTVTNAAGLVTTLSNYDANSRAGQITDPNGLVTTLTYTPRGWLKQRVTNADGVSETTTYDYDGVGQMTKVTLPDNSSINYVYDDAHRLTRISDNLGNSINYTLDVMGNRVNETVTDIGGNLTRQVSRVYDILNRLQTVTGAAQ